MAKDRDAAASARRQNQKVDQVQEVGTAPNFAQIIIDSDKHIEDFGAQVTMAAKTAGTAEQLVMKSEKKEL
ncbi:MAG: hypothetical protein RR672_00245 [Raoultibacter sp.]